MSEVREDKSNKQLLVSNTNTRTSIKEREGKKERRRKRREGYIPHRVSPVYVVVFIAWLRQPVRASAPPALCW
jgi:hypothetical protein